MSSSTPSMWGQEMWARGNPEHDDKEEEDQTVNSLGALVVNSYMAQQVGAAARGRGLARSLFKPSPRASGERSEYLSQNDTDSQRNKLCICGREFDWGSGRSGHFHSAQTRTVGVHECCFTTSGVGSG